MREKKLPVILESDIPAAIEDGAWIEVECVETASKGGNTHRGLWRLLVCAVEPDGQLTQAVLVKVRGLHPRIIKTVSGLMELALELNVQGAVACPLREGDIGVWTFETSRLPPTR